MYWEIYIKCHQDSANVVYSCLKILFQLTKIHFVFEKFSRKSVFLYFVGILSFHATVGYITIQFCRCLRPSAIGRYTPDFGETKLSPFIVSSCELSSHWLVSIDIGWDEVVGNILFPW